MLKREQLCELALSLETDQIHISTIPEMSSVLNKPFPLVLSPVNDDLNLNFIQLQEYFIKKHNEIIKASSIYGAVMFKGFRILSAEEWASIMYSSGLKEMNYIGGAAVRKLIVGNDLRLDNLQILTTNESPPCQKIPFHHELAQTPYPPSHICFYCQHNSAKGGSTPLIRSDLVYDFIVGKYSEFMTRVEQEGVKYVRTVPEVDDPSSAQGRSWRSMFHVETRQQAESEMQKQEFKWEWYENGDCRLTSKVLPAVIIGSNGNKVFFNQIVAAYTGWVDQRNQYGQSVVMGDGSQIPQSIIEDIVQFMESNQCSYQWREGQFCIVDNTVTYHSRQPFSGQRRVMACIANGYKKVKQSDPSDGLYQQTHLVLTRGQTMPSVGLGCWKIPNHKTQQIVYKAIQSNYRLIDEACDYGNEVEAGKGIKQAIDEQIVSRSELFITSKLWNTYHSKQNVKPALLRTLIDLDVDYLDLYLIHFPISLKFVPFEQMYPPEWVQYNDKQDCMQMIEQPISMKETYQAMEQLVMDGLVINIGLCNVNVMMIRDILSYCQIKPAVVQVELHPYNTQSKLIQFCRQSGIAVTGYSNLGSTSYVELGMAHQSESVLQKQEIQQMAQKHNKTEAQIILRWAVQRGTAIIPKTTNEHRLKENIDIFGFQLDNHEMGLIDSMNINKRYNDPGVFCKQAFNCYYPIYE